MINKNTRDNWCHFQYHQKNLHKASKWKEQNLVSNWINDKGWKHTHKKKKLKQRKIKTKQTHCKPFKPNLISKTHNPWNFELGFKHET
jgi:hypothetical protein